MGLPVVPAPVSLPIVSGSVVAPAPTSGSVEVTPPIPAASPAIAGAAGPLAPSIPSPSPMPAAPSVSPGPIPAAMPVTAPVVDVEQVPVAVAAAPPVVPVDQTPMDPAQFDPLPSGPAVVQAGLLRDAWPVRRPAAPPVPAATMVAAVDPTAPAASSRLETALPPVLPMPAETPVDIRSAVDPGLIPPPAESVAQDAAVPADIPGVWPDPKAAESAAPASARAEPAAPLAATGPVAAPAMTNPVVTNTTSTGMPATPVFAPPAPPADARQANPLEAAIARQVGRAAARHGVQGAPMVVRITPPELGTVRIELQQREGRVEARLSAEDEGVRQALDRMLPQLRADLTRADSRITEVSVAPSQERGGGQQGSGDPAGDGRAWAERQSADRQEQARDGARQSRRGDGVAGPLAAVETAPRAPRAAVRTHQGAVDLLA